MAMVSRWKVGLLTLGGVTLSLWLATPAPAEMLPVRMTGQHGAHYKGRSRLAVISYSINYIIAQQATAVGGWGTRARVASTLAGVDESTMRALANEAHADLKAQFAAAGIPVASDAEAKGVLTQAGVELIPGNRDDGGGTGGITIGTSVKKAYVSFGADAAPLTNLYQSGGKVGGLGMIATMGRANKLNRPGEAIDAVLLSPSLTLDFAEMEANRGSRGASAGGSVVFKVRVESPVNIQNPAKMGFGTPGMMRPDKDYASAMPFAAVDTGGADVRALSNGSSAARGDAVIVDPAAWAALGRDAYRSSNAAIVAAIVKVRKA
jgi:hypothetical protein